MELAEFEVMWMLNNPQAGKENAVADALSRNPREYIEDFEDVKFCVFSSLALGSRNS